MPAIYTHDIFGKDVYRKLSPEIKEIVKMNKRLYRIGLQGPDIFYFYRPFFKNKINRLGQSVHEHSGACFFCQAAVKYMETEDRALMAYLFGVCCHYVLDINCHPLIEEFESDSRFSHAEIEAEMDRTWMEREGKDPFTYKPGRFLRTVPKTCEVISCAYGHVTEKQVERAVADMKKYTDLFVCKDKWKRECIWKVLELAGCRHSVGGHIITEETDPEYEEVLRNLKDAYEKAVEKAVELTDNLYACMTADERLSPEFKKDFMGREFLHM